MNVICGTGTDYRSVSHVESEMDISLSGQQKVIDTDWRQGFSDRLTDICTL